MEQAAVKKHLPAVRPEYRPLHKYLVDRFASRVVLTLTEIEDVMGSQLPEEARTQAAWWTSDVDGSASPQAVTWIAAGRTATPNLPARSVTFERTSN